MSQKDFKVKLGIEFGGDVRSNTNGFIYDYTANTLSIDGSQVAYDSNVNLVQENVASLTTAVNNVSSNVTGLETRLVANINTVSSNVSSLENRVTANLNAIQSNVNSVSSNVTTLDTRLTTSFTNLTANINSVASNVATVDNRLTTSFTNLTANINSVASNVATVDSRLTTSFTNLTANINSVASNVSNLDTRVTTSFTNLTANINSVASNVTNILTGDPTFAGTVTIQEDLIVAGNFFVGGNTTYIESTDLYVTDRTITLSNGATTATFDSGLLISRGTDGNVFIGFNESSDQFIAGYTTNSGGNTTTDFSIYAYANARFDNIQVDGLVDGVDVSALSANVVQTQINVNTLSSNIVALDTRVTSNLNAIQSNVNSVSANVATLDTRVTTSFTNVTANINSVASNVTALDTRVTSNLNTIQSNVTNITNGTTPFSGPVTFQDSISTPLAKINTQLHVGSNTTTSIGASETTIFTFAGAIYRGVELTLLVQDVTNAAYQLSKMLVVHDGNKADWTEYGIVNTGLGFLNTFNVSIDGSDVVSISSVGGSTNKKITVASHYLIQ
jgi:hypothetical protein